ncbi:conserved hypothetical protein, partial [Ixodes scapularis]
KVKRIVDYIDTKCRENFVPGPKTVIDESTVGFKGRVLFKWHNPQKPTKWGLRIYVLKDSATGYVSALLPYYGSGAPTHPWLRTTGLVDKVLSSVQGTGFHLYIDRYYTSPQLAEELLKLGITTTGTVMTTRKDMPPQLKKKKNEERLHTCLSKGRQGDGPRLARQAT